MARVKQKHRLLENAYFSTEKMLTNAHLQGLIDYPRAELRQALEDLLFCQFHDALPGSSISEVESHVLQRMDHGLEILSRLRSKAFFSLLSGQRAAEEGEFPIFVYNPHPIDYEYTVVCEFQPPEPNFNREVFMLPEIKDNKGNDIPYQLEKESCNIDIDQRKRVVFRAELKASAMNRFSCRLKEVKADAKQLKDFNTKQFIFKTDTCEVAINPETGLMNRYRVDGVECLKPGSFKPMVIKDSADPWGMRVRSFRDVEGAFTLMTEEESAEFAGVSQSGLEPVRIIEDEPIRTTVEALFKYNRSSLCLRYKVPKTGSEIEIDVRVYWMEKDKMLKLSIPSVFQNGKCLGQVAYGVQEFDRHAEELVAQKWVGIISSGERNAITVINDGTHGFDYKNGELRLSLLRSTAYSGHPVTGKEFIVPQDRFEPRIDQGERSFKFWLNAGSAEDRLSEVNREAQVKNEPPISLCCYPSGSGRKTWQGVTLSDKVVQLTALKMSEDNKWLIIRLFEPTGISRETRVNIPSIEMEFNMLLKGFEIKSIAVDTKSRAYFAVDLLERRLS